MSKISLIAHFHCTAAMADFITAVIAAIQVADCAKEKGTAAIAGGAGGKCTPSMKYTWLFFTIQGAISISSFLL